MKTEVLDLGALPGLEEVVDSAGGNERDLSTVTEAIDASDLPLQATMGVRESVSSLMSWLRGRRFVRSMPPETVTMTWFECHVPRGGAAQERLESTQSGQAGVVIKAFGTGLGRGRKIAVTASTEAAAPRRLCVSYLVDLRVLPHLYVTDDRESVVAEVLEPVADRSVDVDPCPYCSVAPEQVDPFDNEFDDIVLDLRRDSVGRRKVEKLDWTTESSVDAGLTLPKLGLDISVNARLAGQGTFSVTYDFPAGYLFQGYRPLDGRGRLGPRWAYVR
ncbi:hypothetical protein [Geodermatophilus sp. URMC 62]|uniref:hypothetical protein n=1 Tax=Geodermatophilus sp. URMC 62 TaxID=3423414 RepID=UPI00406C8F0F